MSPSGKMIRVLLLADSIEVRGTSAYTLRLARELEEHGIAREVVCPHARVLAEAERNELPLREYPRVNMPFWGRVVMGVVRNELEPKPPHLIHVQSRSMHRKGAWLAKQLEVPYVVTVHDYLNPSERLRLDARWGKRVIAVSQSVKSELADQARLSRELISVIHAGVDIPNEPEDNVLPPDRMPVVGTACPLEAVKGLPYFLGAAQRVRAVRPDVQFLVAGAGPEERNLRRVADALDLTDAVTFIPNLRDFTQALQAMDIFCLPSLKQGLGTTMLEAMAFGKPVIATGVGGVYSVIRENETGLVVPPRDSARLAERILELVNDPVRARVIAATGKALVCKDFTVQGMVRETAALYREVLDSEERVEKAVSEPKATG